ncbi:tetratricopeptide repeat protein [Geobacter argillaceus]|uniref:tetratricopeptide repeat protein n=1 Tax=Geobacter argillaceus TaxID=345631 RepID=UPI00119F16EC|nr:tetratricopeptide repeat protein [Geobacter argillaceus]
MLILSLLPGPAFAIDTQDSQIFISGFNAYQKKDYTAAIDKMSQVLQKYPDSPLRDMAIFWLARSNFKAGYNKDAAKYMAQFFKEYPDSPLKGTVEEDLVALVGKFQKGEPIVDKVQAPLVAQAPAEDKGAAAKVAREKAEAERLAQEKAAKEKAEVERLAAEKASREKAAVEQAAKAKAEADRLAADQAARAKAEAERQAAEKLARAKAEAERLALEKAAKEKAEAERLAAEKASREKAAVEQAAKAKAEADRLAAEQAARAKAEADRLAAEQAARAKAEAERQAAEKLARDKAEAERLAIEKAFREKAETERLAVEKAFREKAEQERLAAEKATAEKAGQERIALEKAVAAPVAAGKAAAAAVTATAAMPSTTVDQLRAAKEAAEKLVAEKSKALAELQEPAEKKGLTGMFLRERSSYRKEATARLTAEKAAAEKDLADAQSALDRALSGQAPVAQVAQPSAEAPGAAKAAQEKAEADRLAAAKAVRVKAEAERLALEKAAKDKAGAERMAAEQAAKAKAEAQRQAAEKLAGEKAEAGRLALEKATKEKAEAERLAAEKFSREKVAAEQAAKAKADAESQAAEKLAREKAAVEKLAMEKAAKEKAEAERLAAEKTVREKAATEQVATEQAAKAKSKEEQRAAEEVAAIKQAAERIIKGKTEEERLAEEKDVAEQARQAAILLEVSKGKAAEKARKQAELEARFKADDEAAAEEARRDALRIAREQEGKGQQAAEKQTNVKAEAERLAAAGKVAREKAEAERLATEKAAKAKADAERLAREKEEQQRLVAEKATKEKAEQERLAAADKAAREKAAKEKAEQERLAAEKAVTTGKAAARTAPTVSAVAEQPVPAAPVKQAPTAAPKTVTTKKQAVPRKDDVAKRTALRDRAIAEYKSLVDRYPGSKAAALATAKLRELGIAYPAGAAKPGIVSGAAVASVGENAKVLSLEVGQYSDLDFAVSPDAPSYEVGKQLSIPFEITNRGNSRDSFMLESSFPAEYGLRFVAAGAPDKLLTRTPPLNAGEKFKGVALFTIPSRYIDGEKVIFPVKAASEFDPVVSQSRGISLIASSPLLRAVIKTDKVQVLPGERVPYKVTLLNIGSAAARQLTMRLTYPPQYEPVDLSASGFREEGKGAVAVEGLQLASGESKEFSIAFRLKDEALARQELFVRAVTDNLSLKRTDAFLSAAAVVQPVSGVAVAAHTDKVVVIPGQTATVPLTVTNTGNIRDDFSLKPVVPQGLVYAFYLDLNRDGVRQANEPIINHVGPLAPKEVANVVLEISSSATEKDGVTVPLTLAFEPESDKAKGASVAVSMIYSRPVVNLAMAGKGGKMKPGQVSTFELDCGNSGSSLAKIVEIQSLMPEQIELVASDPGFSKGSDGTFIWKFEELGAGEKRSIKVTYRVKSGTAVGTNLQLKNVLKYQDRLGNVY